MKRHLHLIVIALCLLLITTNGSWLLYARSHLWEPATPSEESKYPYLSKRIFAENQNDMLINFAPLRKQIEAKFESIGQETERSFYFEYLPTGTSIRIGGDAELVAASLIKLPLVMNLYKAAELNKINLDQEVQIQPNELDNAYGELWKKGAGTRLTLREAARLTLIESDNTATHVIFNHIRGLLSEEDQSLARLDVDQNLQNGQAVINARAYTSVLKSLYLSSYLQERNHSQEILSYLTESQETRRLTNKLPRSVKVAHKNGVFNAQWAESDCGIVYAAKRPYALCVMVGMPEDQANSFIADISKEVYDFVVSR